MDLNLNHGEWDEQTPGGDWNSDIDGGRADGGHGRAVFVHEGGKSRGKGRAINGNCNHCGRFGHMKQDCLVLDKEMAERRHAAGTQKGHTGALGKGFPEGLAFLEHATVVAAARRLKKNSGFFVLLGALSSPAHQSSIPPNHESVTIF